MITLDKLKDNIATLHNAIEQSAAATGRATNDIKLLAVTKQQTIETIELAIQCGLRDFAENRVQDALIKIEALQHHHLTWHFIGRIQENKTRKMAENFSWVHSLSDLKIAQRLNDQRPADLPPLNICIQVNIDEDANKSGIDIEQTLELANAIKQLPRLHLRGLMTILKQHQTPEQETESFQNLFNLYQQLNKQDLKLDTLSMGMSQDFTRATAAGSNCLRIGSALFRS